MKLVLLADSPSEIMPTAAGQARASGRFGSGAVGLVLTVHAPNAVASAHKPENAAKAARRRIEVTCRPMSGERTSRRQIDRSERETTRASGAAQCSAGASS